MTRYSSCLPRRNKTSKYISNFPLTNDRPEKKGENSRRAVNYLNRVPFVVQYRSSDGRRAGCSGYHSSPGVLMDSAVHRYDQDMLLCHKIPATARRRRWPPSPLRSRRRHVLDLPGQDKPAATSGCLFEGDSTA
jgi:hypothetical protein